jgi:hypothetical protein
LMATIIFQGRVGVGHEGAVAREAGGFWDQTDREKEMREGA